MSNTTILSEPYPCDGCRFFDRCRVEPVACIDFREYTNTGEVFESPNRAPSEKYYRRMFKG